MTARILDGQKIRDQIFAELKDEVRVLTSAGIQPGLAAVLVGENPASQLYVKSKIAACEQLGLASGLLTRSEEHRLNSSHMSISYAVFCLKKKKRSITIAPKYV